MRASPDKVLILRKLPSSYNAVECWTNGFVETWAYAWGALWLVVALLAAILSRAPWHGFVMGYAAPGIDLLGLNAALANG